MSLKFFSTHLQDILSLYEHATESFPSTSGAPQPPPAAEPSNLPQPQAASSSSRSEPSSPTVAAFTRSLPASIARHIPRGRRTSSSSSAQNTPEAATPATAAATEPPVFSTNVDFACEGLALNGSLQMLPDEGEQAAQTLLNDSAPPAKQKKRVTFPEGDGIVSGYCDAYRAPFHRPSTNDGSPLNLEEMVAAYRQACRKHRVEPNAAVEKQLLTTLHTCAASRQPSLSLKGIRVNQAHMESLEEIFRRVQFDMLDFEYAYLDDECAIGLTEMIDFYESAKRLNLSFNQKIGVRGWNAIFRMLRRSSTLTELDLRYTSLNHRTVPLFARTLRCQHSLTVLRLENCAISSQSLLILVCAFKANRTLRELYLGENNLAPTDGAHLYQLLTGSQSIELLDLRHNNLQDAGLGHICDALRDVDAQKYSRLHTLVLWNNRFTPQGMLHISRALSCTSKLETLNLGCNQVASAGVDHMKDALARNHNLQRLGLQACRLNCQAAIALAEVLAENVCLTRLDLRDNQDIRSAGLLALHLAVKMNTTMTSLNLDASCCVTNAKTKELSEQFKRYYDEVMQICEQNEAQAEQRQQQAANAVPELTAQLELDTTGAASCPMLSPACSVSPAEEATSLNDAASAAANESRSTRTLSMTCDEPVNSTYATRLSTMPAPQPTAAPKPRPKTSDSDDEPTSAGPVTVAAAVMQNVPESVRPTAPAPSPPTQPASAGSSRRGSVCSADEADTLAELQHQVPVPPQPAASHCRQRRVSEGTLGPSTTAAAAASKSVQHQRRKNRFAVARVSGAADPVMLRPTALQLQQSPRQPSVDDEDVDRTVNRVVQDLLNFCSYEVGDESVVNTPSVPRARRDEIRSSVSSEQLTPDESPPTSGSSSRLHSVALVGHLPEHVSLPAAAAACPTQQQQHWLHPRPADETDAQLDADVRRCVRELVRSCIVLERDTLRRSVIKKRNRLINSTFASPSK